MRSETNSAAATLPAQAARCGVDTIEHASFLTKVRTSGATDEAGGSVSAPAAAGSPTTRSYPDTLAALVAHRPWIVPRSPPPTRTPSSTEPTRRAFATSRTGPRSGAPPGAWTVAGHGNRRGQPGRPQLGLVVDIEQFHQLDMSTAETLIAATGHGADVLGLTDRGVIRQGIGADIVAVSGDPLRHLDALRTPSMVMQGGAVVHRVHQQPNR